jgi:hypothetical protein
MIGSFGKKRSERPILLRTPTSLSQETVKKQKNILILIMEKKSGSLQ